MSKTKEDKMSTENYNNDDDFITINASSVPEGGDDSKFEPLPEGPYSATCVAMVTGMGAKYRKSEDEPIEPEQKVRFVFAIEEDGDVKYVRTNWMKISLWDKEPNPSALWVIVSAWTNQKSIEKLLEKRPSFDLKMFIGKPIVLGLKLSKDEKWNIISDYYAPKKGAPTLEKPEIPEFCIKGDKRVKDGIRYITMDGATIKPKKDTKVAEPAQKAEEVAEEVESDSLPF